jgi:hypothetical protein
MKVIRKRNTRFQWARESTDLSNDTEKIKGKNLPKFYNKLSYFDKSVSISWDVDRPSKKVHICERN